MVKPVLSGLVSHIQKYSLQDGPGIRTTVFLKGCPLRCAWCHNPENISARPEVVLFEGRCIRCGLCAEVCPNQTAGEPAPGTMTGACSVCGLCVESCPSGAREMIGREMGVPELMREILSDRIFYDGSEGGVTFSGGEPLMQWGFLQAVLEKCRARGVHTAVDTCGFASRDRLLGIVPQTDLFLYDLKFMDPARHARFCGVDNEIIIENLRALDAAQARIWLRVPILPGLNDDAGEIEAMARFAGTLGCVTQVNLLPYHRAGVQKFRRLGQEYALPDLRAPSGEDLQSLAGRFASAGLAVKIGG